MNPEEQLPTPEDSIDTIDADDNSSVDDFIRELEAKEKDLHITADLKIEIEDSDFDFDFVVASEPAKTEPEPAAAAAEPLPTAAPTATKARNFELEKEIAALKVRVMELKAERSDMQEKNDRRLKDFESFKYRVDRERRGSFIDQIANLAAQMLPVLDNLDRALESARGTDGNDGQEFQQFYNGIVLVNQQVNEVFTGMGVLPIATIGEPFDPNFHEAVAAEVRSDLPPNTVSDELLRGYRIGNKVIRHSMVKVTTAPPQEKTYSLSDEPRESEVSDTEDE